MSEAFVTEAPTAPRAPAKRPAAPAVATQRREVPFFNYPALFAEHRDEYLATMTEVLERGAYIM
jgi:hypothetical protein